MPERKIREVDTSKTRENVISAADELIARNGLKGTSVSAVARELGMSHANVYRHFSSRNALLEAVASRWMKEMRDACEEAIIAPKQPSERLACLVMTIRDQLARRTTNPAALDLYEFALREMPQAALEHHAHRTKLITDIVESSQNVTAILDGLRGFTDPQLLFATTAQATPERVQKLCELLCR